EAEISTPVGPVNVKIKKEGEKIEIKAESKNKIKIIARLKNKKIQLMIPGKRKLTHSVSK
ncbi:MAG: hypothetical protein NC831_06970, partial [Candidatus Omnitrophica bacterium]|nr:hypothetical protein [Candidatus Omnitrophota bacterium]